MKIKLEQMKVKTNANKKQANKLTNKKKMQVNEQIKQK